jgi:guanylate kinase
MSNNAALNPARIERRGLMLILSAPSGAGKSTLTGRLMAEEAALRLSISATTRAPRGAEVDGTHYYFLDRVTFEARREAGAFLEWAEVHGNLYGTPRAPVEAALGAGADVLFDIDVQGAAQVAAKAPDDVVRVFILPPSHQELRRRLESRGTDSPDAVARRLANANREIERWEEFDYVLVNDDLDEALASLRAILAAERLKRARCLGLPARVAELLPRR